MPAPITATFFAISVTSNRAIALRARSRRRAICITFCGIPAIQGEFLSELAGEVFLGAPVLRHGEDLVRGAELNELAEVDECREVRDPCCLGHVVGDLDDRDRGLQGDD